ncbi:MAG: hypothetical protein QF535_10910, partial [Anaerolineales bacterium]|nr:hypothetical protein [Anaerolineales bacterium]
MSTCPTAKWGNTTTADNYICSDCATGCSICSDPGDICSQCVTGYFLDDNACVDTCDDGFFGDATDSENPVCTACSTGCKTCSTTADDKCLTCIDGYYFAPDPSPGLSTGKCKQCDASVGCGTCETTATTCLSCAADAHPAYVFIPASNTCETCGVGCSACTKGSS